MTWKAFKIDFKKHFTQAFATFVAGLFLGIIVSSFKFMKTQETQGYQLEQVIQKVDTMNTNIIDYITLSQKIDTVDYKVDISLETAKNNENDMKYIKESLTDIKQDIRDLRYKK
jgi:hypothetical protein